VSILLRYKANPNIVANGGWGPLHSAMLTNKPKITEILLENGANVNYPSDVFLDTPLHIAVRFERLCHHIPNLFEYGADASLSSKLYDSPLEFAAGRNFASVEFLVKPTPVEKHMKAYVAAIKNSALQAIEELMKQDADLGGPDAVGKTVSHHAALHGSIEVVELLSTARFPPSIELQDHAGLTAREIAFMHCEDSEWLDLWNALHSKGRDFAEELQRS
jgi:ankyrin repeat protein